MIVIIPKMVLREILEHAGSHKKREVIGVLLGKSSKKGKIIEITDIVSYPEASHPEKAVLPGTFLYEKVGDEIRKRNDKVNVKGYYHSHPPDVFPLKFSNVDFKQYLDLQNTFARKQPFLAIIVNPITQKYVLLTLDIDKREISLEPFVYNNLIWVDYAVKRFSNGFSPYHINPKTGEGELHPTFEALLEKMSEKYRLKKIVKIMLDNAEKYMEDLEKYGDQIEESDDLLTDFKVIKTLYFNEDFMKADKALEKFIKKYVGSISEKIEKLKEQTGEITYEHSPLVEKINKKIYQLIKGAEENYPNNATKIAGIILKINRKLNNLGEPFCYIEIDDTMKLDIPTDIHIAADHLTYVESLVDEQIVEHLDKEMLTKIEQHIKPDQRDKVQFINALLNVYFQRYCTESKDELNDEINEALILKYIKKGYSMRGLFFENLTLDKDNLRCIFGENLQNALYEIEKFLTEKIGKNVGAEELQGLIDYIKK